QIQKNRRSGVFVSAVIVRSAAALAGAQGVANLTVHAAYRLHGGIPVDAGIGNGNAVFQLGQILVDCLAPPTDMTFHHQADDGAVTFRDLVGNVVHYQRLEGRVLVGVGVAAVNHDVGLDAGLFQLLLAQRDADRVVVGLAVAATQHHVTIAVAAGRHDGHLALVVDTHETVRAGGGLQGVDRHAEVAVGTVLEADRGGQAGGQFPVGLGFGGARANGRPGDQVLQVLGRNRVQRLGGGRQAHVGQFAQQLTADVQTVFDLEGVVQVGV